jgi:phosphatidylserine decarboxylase
MRIAREGMRLLLPLLGVFAIILLTSWAVNLAILYVLAVVVFLVMLSLFFFFRDPDRIIPVGDHLVLAPCDGTVIFVSEAGGDEEQGRVAIFMSVLNVHVNRNPVSGIVQEIRKHRGSFRHAATPDAVRENTSVSVRVSTNFGEVTWIQVAGSLARKISCRLKEGESVAAGERFGLIYLGSRMEVIMPAAVRIQAKLGQRVKAGTTILGKVVP